MSEPKRRRISGIDLSDDFTDNSCDTDVHSTHSTNRDEEAIADYAEIASLEEETEISNLSQQLSQHSLTENEILEACKKIPCLDGKYFEVDPIQTTSMEAVVALCKLCFPRKLIKGSTRVTSNFTSHLKRKHSDIYDEYKEYIKSGRFNNAHRPIVDRRRWTCSFAQDVFEADVVNYVLDSMAPLSVVEKPTFRRIFDNFNIQKGETRLRHLTRYSLAKKINRVFTENSAQLHETLTKLTENGGFVCTTADIYTGSGRRFLGVTVSWIDPTTFSRKSAAIACRRFHGTHSNEAIANNLSEVHLSFGLTPDKIRATITDNGSNFIKAFKDFGISENFLFSDVLDSADHDDLDPITTEDESGNGQEMELDTNFSDECAKILPRHLRCASHTLNLIATADAKKAIARSDQLNSMHNNVLGKCNGLWKMLRSPKSNECLKKNLGVALKRPVVTRWNSFFDSAKQLVSLKEKLLQPTIGTGISLRDPFNRRDFQYLEEYVICTSDLAQAIDKLQADNCHYGILSPTLISLRRKLVTLRTKDNLQFCKPLVTNMIVSLEKRFEHFYNVSEEGMNAAIAAVAHPLFKGRWLTCLPADKQKAVYEAFLRVAVSESEANEVLEDDHNQYPEDEFDFGDITEVIPEFRTTLNEAERELEIKRYLQSKNTSLEILQEYPVIKKVFLKFNTPLPSSASVERLFSYATMLNLPRFNRLTDIHFEERVLTKANSSKV